jgi:ATP-dependent DNA ligase
VRLWSRTPELVEEFTAITAAIRGLKPNDIILDGEGCAHDDTGHNI